MEENSLNTSSSEDVSQNSFDAKIFATKIKEEKLTFDRARDDYKRQGACCDVSITGNAGDQIIRAHSVVLTAYSSYFESAFSPHFKEGQQKSLSLSAWKVSDIRTILDIIYGCSFELTPDNVLDIYYLADYLIIEHVSSICLEYVKSSLNIEQALELWKNAKRGGNLKLIKLAKEFSLRNFSKLMKNKNSGLYDLTSKQLLSIIRQDDLKVRNERKVLDCIYMWASHNAPPSDSPLGRFADVNICKLIFQGVRFGKMTKNPLCNCCNMAKNKVNEPCLCRQAGEQCPRHLPSFEDYPNLETHVSSCAFCKKQLNLLIQHQTEQKFPDKNEVTRSSKDDITAAMWYRPRTSYETIVAVGGWNDNSPTSHLQIYNPQADAWALVPMDEAYCRAYHGLVELNGVLYCVGGFSGTERLNTTLCLDNETLKWIEKSPMHERRCYVCVVALKSYIYAIGGHDGTTRLKSMERYDPLTNQWLRMKNMHLVRSDASATVHNNKIYVLGGFDGEQVHNAVEVFDPDEDMWSFAPQLVTPRSGVRAVSCKGKLAVLGGFNGERRLKTIEWLNEDEHQWEVLESQMSIARSNFGIEVFGKYVAVFGGYDDERRQTTPECEAFCFEEGKWSSIAPMPIAAGCSALSVVTIRKVNAHLPFIKSQEMIRRNEERTTNAGDHQTAAAATNQNGTINSTDANNNNNEAATLVVASTPVDT